MNHEREEKIDASTWLVIPYFNGDRGVDNPAIDRPLPGPGVTPGSSVPASVVPWACPSISINGVPHAGVFTPGVPMKVGVDVKNYGAGAGAAPVTVMVYYAEVGTGLTGLTAFGMATTAVAANGVGGPMPPVSITNTMPKGVSPHVCIIAYVYSAGVDEMKSTVPLPATDRHWAQLNLVASKVGASGSFQFMFWVGNPFGERASFEIRAQPVRPEALRTLSRQLRADPAEDIQARLRLQALKVGRDIGAQDDQEEMVRLDMEGRTRLPFVVSGQLGRVPRGPQFAAIEVVQLKRRGDQRQVTGSFGLVLYAR